MKYIYTFLFITCFALLVGSCKKGAPLRAVPPQIVKVQITGSTTKELEFIYKDSVIASGPVGGNFTSNVLLNTAGQSAEIKVKEKGASTILNTLIVTSSSFSQNFSVFYDGTKTYERTITYRINGYAMSGELEFLLDGNLEFEGSSKIVNDLKVYVNDNETRELIVRKKGETTPLITKVINPLPETGQSLKFFFDGVKIADNIELTPPSNPSNMSITGQFSSLYKKAADGAIFKGGNVDLVFYIRNKTGIVTNPSIRITAPSDGKFITFELPPLPNADSFYTYDICEVGTDVLPYTDFALLATYPPKIHKGRFYGEIKFGNIYFEAGASKLILMQDANSLKASPAADKGRYFYGKITDLSQYFQ